MDGLDGIGDLFLLFGHPVGWVIIAVLILGVAGYHVWTIPERETEEQLVYAAHTACASSGEDVPEVNDWWDNPIQVELDEQKYKLVCTATSGFRDQKMGTDDDLVVVEENKEWAKMAGNYVATKGKDAISNAVSGALTGFANGFFGGKDE